MAVVLLVPNRRRLLSHGDALLRREWALPIGYALLTVAAILALANPSPFLYYQF